MKNTQNFTEEVRALENQILRFLHEMIEASAIEENVLYIEDSHLEIEPRLAQLKNGIAQVVFRLKHPIFQEEIIESVAGVGPTGEEAVKNAVIQFVSSVFTVLQRALKSEAGEPISVQVLEKKNEFRFYQSSIKTQGKKRQEEGYDYWELLGDELVKRIGNKRVYLIKVYVAKNGENTISECRVNGMVYPLFNEKLKQVAAKWELETQFYSEKQIFILIQEESTYKAYPLTQKELEQFVLSSLLLYRQCDSQEKYDELRDVIIKSCPIPSLGEELFGLIPEIFTEIIFSEVTYLDQLCLVKGEMEIELSKHQLTSYDWIYRIIERTIRAGYYEKEQVDRIISCSAQLNCINQARNGGSKLEDLYTGGIVLPVGNEYEVL